jgi:hypothetical protein
MDDSRYMIYLGPGYREKVARLQSMIGATTGADAVRTVVDAILEDSDARQLETVPRRALGIKPFSTKRPR